MSIFDSLSGIEQKARGNFYNTTDNFAAQDSAAALPGTIGGEQEHNEDFGRWYEGKAGENTTKAGLAAILAYAMGGAGGMFSGMGGEGAAGGSTSTGGVGSTYGGNASSMLGNLMNGLGGGGGGDTTQKRRGVLRASPQVSSPLFSFGDDMIDPQTSEMLRRSTLV
jgi:hypothetical protein